LENVSGTIVEANWRDQTLRDLAKLYAARGQVAQAMALIPRVENPDTRAMTIRGIGMEIGALALPKAEQDKIFTALRAEADKIDHVPSHGIALTYIAMAQAFAGDDDGAFATAQSMSNEALRHKAFAENAEIQAAKGKLDQALKSLGAIGNLSFRNKAHTVVSKIFADQEQYDSALDVARKVENEYQRAQALLYILNRQTKPGEGMDMP
jgi:tetratricopeptide (TPR) repeat protein